MRLYDFAHLNLIGNPIEITNALIAYKTLSSFQSSNSSVLFVNVAMTTTGTGNTGFKGTSLTSFLFKNSEVSNLETGIYLTNFGTISLVPQITNTTFTDCNTAVKAENISSKKAYFPFLQHNKLA